VRVCPGYISNGHSPHLNHTGNFIILHKYIYYMLHILSECVCLSAVSFTKETHDFRIWTQSRYTSLYTCVYPTIQWGIINDDVSLHMELILQVKCTYRKRERGKGREKANKGLRTSFLDSRGMNQIITQYGNECDTFDELLEEYMPLLSTYNTIN